MAGLDADDIASLPTLDRHDKQAWAEMLADRLTRGRTAAHGSQGDAGNHRSDNNRIRQATMNERRRLARGGDK